MKKLNKRVELQTIAHKRGKQGKKKKKKEGKNKEKKK